MSNITYMSSYNDNLVYNYNYKNYLHFFLIVFLLFCYYIYCNRTKVKQYIKRNYPNILLN